MAEEQDDIRDDEEENDAIEEEMEERKKNLAKSKKVRTKLLDMYKDIERGFEDQLMRAGDLQDYWDLYNSKLSTNQKYNGISQRFMPIIYNAVNARKTRFTNQVFPQTGRYVDVISTDGTIPHAIMALAEHYVKKSKLRSWMPAILRNWDIEGQLNIYVDWSKRERHVVERVKKPAQMGDVTLPEEEDVDDIEESTLTSEHPYIDVIADSKVLILPITSSSPEEAIADGGSVTIARTWSKSKIQELMDDGQIDTKEGEALLKEMTKETPTSTPDKEKKMAEAAGIKGRGPGKFAVVYETWSIVKTPEGRRICRTYFGGKDKILSCVRNPYWSDRIPLISVPQEKIQGCVKGISKIEAVADIQYFVNDVLNQGADSVTMALTPITMTDPERNPKVGSMVLAPGAVWLTDPNTTKPYVFPPVHKEAMELVEWGQQKIFQTLSVNPSQITQGTKKKQNQAEIAQEQQVDILTTADVVTVLEHCVLTPLIERFIELDHQFRNEEIQVRAFGELGMQAEMQNVPLIQMGTRYQFRWLGVEAARNAQAMQQQIAFFNVLKGTPPQMFPGYKLNAAPLLKQMAENLFGPRLAPLILEDTRSQFSIDPLKENGMLRDGHNVPIHQTDNHKQHIEAHVAGLQEWGDPHGAFQLHIAEHQKIIMEQMQAQMAAMAPKGLPGAPGGAGPGVAGTPRPGAQPMPQRPVQQPPGMIKQDQMQDPSVMPG